MKLSGSYEFNASPEKVWQTLTNPDFLSTCIPGLSIIQISETTRLLSSS